MKRLLLLFPALLLAALLGGCGQSEIAEAAATASPPPETPVLYTPAPTPEPLPTPTPTPPESVPIAFSQEVIADENCALRVTGIGMDWRGNWVIHLQLENRTGETADFRFLYQSVNGVMIEDTLYRVGAGRRADESFRVSSAALEALGFAVPGSWRFVLRVSSCDSPTPACLFEEYAVYPFGEPEATEYLYHAGDDEIVAMDNDYLCVFISDWRREDGGWSFDFAAVNKTDVPLRLLLPGGEVRLNGRSYAAALDDPIGSRATLLGYLFVSEDAEQALDMAEFTLAVATVGVNGSTVVGGTETTVHIQANS